MSALPQVTQLVNQDLNPGLKRHPGLLRTLHHKDLYYLPLALGMETPNPLGEVAGFEHYIPSPPPHTHSPSLCWKHNLARRMRMKGSPFWSQQITAFSSDKAGAGVPGCSSPTSSECERWSPPTCCSKEPPRWLPWWKWWWGWRWWW